MGWGFPLFHGVLGKGLALSYSLFVNLPDVQEASYVWLLGEGRGGYRMIKMQAAPPAWRGAWG